MIEATLPMNPEQVARLIHDHDLDGDAFRLLLWLCAHTGDTGTPVAASYNDLQKGAGFRRGTRALSALNLLIEGGYVILLERQWKLGRLSGVTLKVASSPTAAKAVDRAAFVMPRAR